MNSESVLGWLEAMGVPPRVVSVAAERDDAWCLLRDDSEGQQVWDVFWREQGNRYDWARFSDERVACFYLFGRLTWTQALRGAVGPLDSGSTPPRGVPIPGGSADPGSGFPDAGGGSSESASASSGAGSASSGSGSASSGSGSGSPDVGNGPATPATGNTPAEPDSGSSHRDTSGTEQGAARSERHTSGG
ncbi:hypothetical protein SAMN04487904_102456 [Actinopolyspora lacussalsi subsp. righensis]|uniref:Uncharacterized protein n=1 Tax=Actinopolyspora righensis TaxID=995060 RepID=A0A1I6YEE3_9ACTN|nr:hypothetical protein [Actinopolyspora righensis]SFT48772.1 hypothetical protein SAMN04487904_102456 [Actinopolyspora righensis]